MKGFLYHTAAAMRREIGRIARMRMYRMLLFYLPLAAFAFFRFVFQQGCATQHSDCRSRR